MSSLNLSFIVLVLTFITFDILLNFFLFVHVSLPTLYDFCILWSSCPGTKLFMVLVQFLSVGLVIFFLEMKYQM